MPPPATDQVHYDPVPLHSGDISDQQAPYDPYGAAASTPTREMTPMTSYADLGAPRPRFMGSSGEDPSFRDSYASSQYHQSTAGGSEYNGSTYALNMGPDGTFPRSSTYTAGYRDDPTAPPGTVGTGMTELGASARDRPPAHLSEKAAVYGGRPKNRQRLFIIAGGVAAVLLVLAIAIPVAVTLSKKGGSSSDSKSSSTAGGGGGSSGSAGASATGKPVAAIAVTGGDGSTVTMDDGSTFTYQNSFGGYWYYDPQDPFHNAAKPNSWTPALNETFKWGKDRVFGVNLGGWLNTEPFMCVFLPSDFSPHPISSVSSAQSSRFQSYLLGSPLSTRNITTPALRPSTNGRSPRTCAPTLLRAVSASSRSTTRPLSCVFFLF
jgi:glucan 1,3-beta-glucosidase